jgi:cation diffusion facilitator family transporter
MNIATTVNAETADTTDSTAARQQAAARLSLGSNIFLVLLKIGAGLASGSISVLAEGLQSTVDVVASLLIVLTVRAAASPPDESHPYGHGKFENLVSLAQMLLILGTAGYLLLAAWSRWQHPAMPRLDYGIGALIVSAVVNTLVSRRLHHIARETGSQALEAESLHLKSDLLACVGLLLGLVVVGVTKEPRLDPLIAAVMTAIGAIYALRLLRETLRPLLDESLPVEEAAYLKEILESDVRVRGYHRLRTRRSGSHRLVDMHILLDDELTLVVAHAIAEEVEEAIRRALPNADVIVHAEPFEEEIRHCREQHDGTPHASDIVVFAARKD